MSKNTKIEWCDSSVNPVIGCTGCELWNKKTREGPCFAAETTSRFKGNKGWPDDFGVPTGFPGRVVDATQWSDMFGEMRPEKPWMDGKARHIFVSDLGDMFCMPPPWLWENVFKPMLTKAGRNHIWVICTKRPSKLLEYVAYQKKIQGVAWPQHIISLTSVTSQDTTRRVEQLLQMPEDATIGVSIEPMLTEVNLFSAMAGANRAVDWIILGGESGDNPRPIPEGAAEKVLDLATTWEIPFFYKQRIVDGKKQTIPELNGVQYTEMPEVVACPITKNPT